MNDKKRAGIITYYYKTTNYGGILQAYALCKYLNKIGVYAEQIAYDYDTKVIKANIVNKIKKSIKKLLSESLHRDCEKINIKKEAFEQFDKNFICSSKKVYTYQSLKVSDPGDDFYISGSDQIWNPIAMDENFFLAFVSDSNKKYAYAASIGADKISEDKNIKYKKMLESYTLISVRENTGKLFLDKIGIKAEVVPDPIFLLKREEWIRIINYENKRAGKYLLTYFLGNSDILKNFAIYLSCKYKFNIIDISPFGKFKNKINVEDNSDAGPTEFLSYIYNAEYVLTNSFHCTAFSLMFQKKFLVEEKFQQTNITSNDRIITLLDHFALTKHFINSDSKNLESLIEEEFQCNIDEYSKSGKDFIKKILEQQNK